MIKHFEESNDEKTNNLSAIFLLKSNQIDIHAWPVPLCVQKRTGNLGFYNEFLEITKTVASSDFRVGNFLNKPNAEKTDFSSFLYNNLNLLLIMLIGYLLIKLSALIFSKLSYHQSLLKNLKLVLLRAFNINQRASIIGLLILSLNLFMFFSLTFLRGTIKTDSVIVNTTQLTDSSNKIINNDKTLVIVYYEEIVLSDAPSKSFLKKLYDKKKKENLIFVIRQGFNANNLIKFINQGLTNYLIFADDVTLIFLLSHFSNYSPPGLISFLKSANYYELLSVFTIRRNLDENKKKLINKNIDIAFENGFLSNMLFKIKSKTFSNIEQNTKVFKTKEDFVDEFTSTSDVDFENYKRIFIYFYSILITILFVFAFQKLCNRLKIIKLK